MKRIATWLLLFGVLIGCACRGDQAMTDRHDRALQAEDE